MEHHVNHATSRSPTVKVLFGLSIIGLVGAVGVHLVILADYSDELAGFLILVGCGLTCLMLILEIVAIADEVDHGRSFLSRYGERYFRIVQFRLQIINDLILFYSILLTIGIVLISKLFPGVDFRDDLFWKIMSAFLVSAFGSLAIFYRHIFGKK